MKRSRLTSVLTILGVTLALAGCGSGSKDKSKSGTNTVTSGGAGDAQYSDPFGTSKNGGKSGATTIAARKRAAAALILAKAAVAKGSAQDSAAKPAIAAWSARFKLTSAAARADLKKYAAESGWTLTGTGDFTRPK